MGRFLFLLILIGAALAGVWFYAPGGKDMLLGVKDKAMGMMPGAAPAEEAGAPSIVADEPADDMLPNEVVDGGEDLPLDDHGSMDDDGATDAPADEPQN